MCHKQFLKLSQKNPIPKKVVILIIITIFLASYTLYKLPQDAQATPVAQYDDPSVQCSLGGLTLLQGDIIKGGTMLEDGFAKLKANPSADQKMLGLCALYLGMYQQIIGSSNDALETYNFALVQFRAIGEKQLEWSMLYAIGSVYLSQGHAELAQQYFETALPLTQGAYCWDIAKMKRLAEGVTFNNIGIAIGGQIFQEKKTVDSYSDVLYNLEQSLEIVRELGKETGTSQLLNLLDIILGNGQSSNCQSATGKFDPADILLNMLGEFMGSSTRAFEPLILSSIGETYRNQGQDKKALDTLGQALEIVQQQRQTTTATDGFELPIEAIIYNNIGMVYYNQGKFEKALANFEQSLDNLRLISHRPGIVSVLTNIGSIKMKLGNLTEAQTDYEEAIDILETIRTSADGRITNIAQKDGMPSSGTSALSGSVGEFRDIYKMAVELYHQTGQDEAAFYAAERGRARLFLDMITVNNLEATDPEIAKLVDRERYAYIRLQAAKDNFVQSQIFSNTNPLMSRSAKTSLAQAQTEYDDISRIIKNKDDNITRVIFGQDKVLGVKDVQALLDKDTTLIYYYVLGDVGPYFSDKGSLAFVITKNQFSVVELPDEARPENFKIARDNINSQMAINQYSDLYDWLIAPLENKLNTKYIGIVPHQQLHYIPFAALKDKNNKYFGEKKTLFTLPSASILPIIQRNARKVSNRTYSSSLIFGNPTISESLTLPILTYAGNEAIAIGKSLSVLPYLQNEAKESLLQTKISNASIVHLAAHGIYNKTNPLDSAIYLSPGNGYDGLLTTGEIYNLNMQNNKIVVLSACKTNEGVLSGGDEIVGLTRAFFTAGSPTVITSLWQVDDESTKRLMTAFYHYWLEVGLSKAEALQIAQSEIRKTNSHPYFWAAFVLNGYPSP